MIDLQDKNHPPILEEIGEYIRNPLFHEFCLELRETFQCREKIEFSSCSWERGWNIKFKKSGKTLCTIYPRETYFTAMLVVGKKEKEPFEAMLSECSKELGENRRLSLKRIAAHLFLRKSFQILPDQFF